MDAAAADVSPKPAREAFARFLTWLRSTPPTEVAQHYVDTFDLRRRCALYLSYYRYGDTRKRGMSMLTFKATYRAAGFDPNTEELPDYLPMVLDFAALTGKGRTLSCAHRSDLELLRRALQQAGTPYADVVEAVIVATTGAGSAGDRRGDHSMAGGAAPGRLRPGTVRATGIPQRIRLSRQSARNEGRAGMSERQRANVGPVAGNPRGMSGEPA